MCKFLESAKLKSKNVRRRTIDLICEELFAEWTFWKGFHGASVHFDADQSQLRSRETGGVLDVLAMGGRILAKMIMVVNSG